MKNIFRLFFFFIFINCNFISSLECKEIVSQETTASSTQDLLHEDFVLALERAEKEGDTNFFNELLRMFISLAVIIVFIILFLWIFKRLLETRVQQVNISSNIKILEHRTITPKTTIYTIEISKKIITFAESSNGVTLLSEFSPSLKKVPEELS